MNSAAKQVIKTDKARDTGGKPDGIN